MASDRVKHRRKRVTPKLAVLFSYAGNLESCTSPLPSIQMLLSTTKALFKAKEMTGVEMAAVLPWPWVSNPWIQSTTGQKYWGKMVY